MRFRPKEPFNSYSHGLGVLLSIAAMVVVVTMSWPNGNRLLAFSIYGVSLVLLYAASTVYHWLEVSPRGEDWLRRLDHTAIFLFIAGSYTPICLVSLRGGWGWGLFGTVWGIAVGGAILKLFFRHLPAWASATIYLGMGWLAIVAIGPLLRAFPMSGLAWLAASGVAYSVGGAIYALERPDPYPLVFGHHEIFHIFVLVGSAAHFVFMQQYIL